MTSISTCTHAGDTVWAWFTELQPSGYCNLFHWNQVNLEMKLQLLSPFWHSPHTDTKLYFIHSHPTQYFFPPFTGKNTRRAQGSRAALRRTHNTPSYQHRLSQLPKLHFFPHCLLIFLVHKQRSITAMKLLTLHINEILAKVSFQFLFYNILNPVKSLVSSTQCMISQIHSVLLSIWHLL